MKINVGKLVIECFENETEYNLFLKDNSSDVNLRNSTLFFGKLYDLPIDVRSRFPNPNEAILEIKKMNYNDVQFILIHQ